MPLCIFCKETTALSRSVEHIIPASLGNTKNILPAGIVCDSCNNYFAVGVEKPLLEAAEVQSLRTARGIPNRRGKIPKGVMAFGSSPAQWDSIGEGVFTPLGPGGPDRVSGSVEVTPEVFREIFRAKSTVISIPSGGMPFEANLVSRLLAKMALEAFIQQVMAIPGSQQRLVEDTQFDPIRDHARRGRPREWPYHARQLYDPDNPLPGYRHPDGQMVYEYTFLYTTQGELYFCWVFFGVEFTINVAGPEIQGYLRWLDENSEASPLYPELAHISRSY